MTIEELKQRTDAAFIGSDHEGRAGVQPRKGGGSEFIITFGDAA